MTGWLAWEAKITLRRIVLFTKNMPGMVALYRDGLGLKLRKDEKGWKEFDAYGCVIALHNGTSEVRRGTFVSVPELKRAIDEFLEAWNEKPRPFVWTATVESICQKLSRCRQTLERIQPGCTRPRIRKSKKKLSS